MAKSFGEKLREFREEAGMSRAELAEETGFDEMAISRWESGEGDPSWSAVQALAKALGINCHEFGDGRAKQAGGGRKTRRAGEAETKAPVRGDAASNSRDGEKVG
jgi:transcriptional regulator with XRE-family HTH domain